MRDSSGKGFYYYYYLNPYFADKDEHYTQRSLICISVSRR